MQRPNKACRYLLRDWSLEGQRGRVEQEIAAGPEEHE